MAGHIEVPGLDDAGESSVLIERRECAGRDNGATVTVEVNDDGAAAGNDIPRGGPAKPRVTGFAVNGEPGGGERDAGGVAHAR